MKCSNPVCNRSIGLVSYKRGWFSKRRYCSRHCRNASMTDERKLPLLEPLAAAFVLLFLLIVPASLAVAALVAPPPRLEAPQPQLPGCDRDLAIARASIGAMQARVNSLAGVDGSEICTATRFYFLEMVKARAVTALCKSGAERDRDLGHFDVDVARINDAIAEHCP